MKYEHKPRYYLNFEIMKVHVICSSKFALPYSMETQTNGMIMAMLSVCVHGGVCPLLSWRDKMIEVCVHPEAHLC
jgi:hypothetical protein